MQLLDKVGMLNVKFMDNIKLRVHANNSYNSRTISTR